MSAQTPLGTAFTYQGQLRQNGQPVFGDANLVFRLYDAATGGTLLGTQTLNGVPVADGLLTVQLNGAGEFGPNALNGEARWLEIEVSGTPLAPRQPVSGAPYALFSSRPWETSATGVFYNAGNVGIGTSAPGALLDVAGAARVSGFNMPTGAGVGRVLKSDGSGNGTWQTDSLTLPFTGTVTSGSAFIITSTAPSNIAGFIMNNAASAAHAIRADSNGAGAALAAVMTGTSHAGYFEVFNSETVNSAVRATSNGNFASAAITATMTGNGKAGYFEILNSNNGSEALYALTNGFGGAIRGDTTGAGDAIFANGLGSGDAVHGAAQGTGRAGSFRITNSSNSREAIFASTTGTGIVGEFINLNATNPNPALSAESSGGVAAYFNGDVGMGLTTPEAPLHVQSGSAGAVTANPATILAIENSTGGWISILTPDGTQRGILFGDASSAESGGIVYDSNNNNGLQFRTGGNVTRMTLDAQGFVGIGVSVPDTPLDVARSSGSVAAFNRTTSDGVVVSIQQDGVTEGSISVSGATVSYNAFTGSHYGWTNDEIERFALVRLTGENRRRHDQPDAEITYGIEATQVANDPACVGAYLGLHESTQPASDENPHLIMSVGNGEMWVIDTGRDIAPGDVLISSDVPGCAMLDDARKFAEGHIVARAAERMEWSSIKTGEDGVRRARLSVLFDRFTRTSDAASIANLRSENTALRAEMVELKALVAALAASQREDSK